MGGDIESMLILQCLCQSTESVQKPMDCLCYAFFWCANGKICAPI